MRLSTFSNPKVLLVLVILLIGLFLISRTMSLEVRPALDGKWSSRLRPVRTLDMAELHIVEGAGSCSSDAARRQLVVAVDQPCIVTVDPAPSALLPPARQVTMTLTSGHFANALVVNMLYDTQSFTVEETLVLSQPVEFEAPQRGARLVFPICTADGETAAGCVVQLGGEENAADR